MPKIGCIVGPMCVLLCGLRTFLLQISSKLYISLFIIQPISCVKAGLIKRQRTLKKLQVLSDGHSTVNRFISEEALMSVLINITGPIAAGATTLANRLAELMSWEKFFEADVEKVNPFFSLYSTNPKRYAFHNQIAFLYRSTELHHQLRTMTLQDKIYLQDFCPFEHTEVYAHVQHNQGILSEEEYKLLLGLTDII